jgi:hypothetical protein
MMKVTVWHFMTNSHRVVTTFSVTSPSKWCCGNFSPANLIDIYPFEWTIGTWGYRGFSGIESGTSWVQWLKKTSNSFSVHSFSCVWFIYWGCECCHVILCFGSGEIVQLEVVDGGLVCSSGVQLEDFGDKSDNCYVVNAAVYVGYWIPVQAIASPVFCLLSSLSPSALTSLVLTAHQAVHLKFRMNLTLHNIRVFRRSIQ